MKATSFSQVYYSLCQKMKNAPAVRTERWQGVDVSKDRSATSYEMLNVDFEVDLKGQEELTYWRKDIRPNLPWADNHFAERVSGSPLNPGTEWENWPWASSADKFRQNELFNHTYAERFWPKYPRRGNGGDYSSADGDQLRSLPRPPTDPMRGINGEEYGDLQDWIELLAYEPYTRQAWFGMWHPEDNGRGDGGRKPCTLGYQLLVRNNRLIMWYPLRSCDLRRHFRDDVYLAIRMMLWVLDCCRELRPDFWKDIVPGTYAMHMTSLHIFENDRHLLINNLPWETKNERSLR